MPALPTPEGFNSWSTAERILYLQDLWDHIVDAAPDAIELTPPQRAELERRIAMYRDRPTAGASWDEVRDRIRSRRG